MKKLLLLPAFCLTFIMLWAQPVINKAFMPQNGKVYYKSTYTVGATGALWASGADTAWDMPYFGNDKITAEEFIKITPLSLSPFFPKATHYSTSTDTSGREIYKYYSSSTDSFCYLGYNTYHPKYTILARWVDPESSLRYPVTYLDSFEDDSYFFFYGKNNDDTLSSTAYTWLHTKTVADGYGKLRFLQSERDSVLRLRITTTTIRKWYIFYDSGVYYDDTITTTTLVWLSPNYNGPIIIAELTGKYGENNKAVTVTYNPDITLSVSTPKTIDAVSVYPNPAGNYFTLQHPWEQLKCTLTDITGKQLETHVVSGTENVSVGHLPAGIYFIHLYHNGDYIGAKKLVKQ